MRLSNLDKSSKARQANVKHYFGNYLGIVVQNNDPSKTGRVKIFIPHLSPTVYENWVNVPKDKHFKFIGKNIDSDLTNIVDDLKGILPWAECAAPLAGSSASGRYNAKLETGSISDSAKLDTTVNDNPVSSKYNLNPDQIGEKPARVYETAALQVTDGFNNTTVYDNGSINFSLSGTAGQPNNSNPLSYNYVPKSYSNNAKGSFSVPNVGAHVWVFFAEGDPNRPIYWAASFGAQDWQGIYESSDAKHGFDYPGTYENKSDGDNQKYNHNVETYRNKYVISQKGGVVEFVNTDNKEILKLTHYSGSFKEFNNKATIELATANDQKLVLADQFLTVKGNKNEYVDYDFDQIIRGDYYKKVGTFNKDKIQSWHDIVEKFAEVKQLFEIKRAQVPDIDPNSPFLLRKLAGNQQRKGTFAPCPLCNADDRDSIGVFTYKGVVSFGTKVTQENSDPSVQDFVEPDSGTAYILQQPTANFTNFLNSGPCPVCNGTGLSPSSQDGTWDTEDKASVIDRLAKQHIAELSDLEAEMGLGGSEIINITKHRVETIGLVMNDFPSVRIDDVGKISNSEVKVLNGGVVVNKKATPLLETVHVDDMPGGTYSMTACNKYNVQVGSGGISMKSYGPVDIGGTMANIGAEQVNVTSENEINLVAGKRLNIVSDILTLRQKNGNQVLVDSNLGVSKNVVIGGGMHVEGELSVQHVTAPLEMQETLPVILYGELVAGATVTNGSGTAVATPNSVKIYAHSHPFKNLPLTLKSDNEGVRDTGANNNLTDRHLPTTVVNEHKGGGRSGSGS
jgi:hypothetical protein